MSTIAQVMPKKKYLSLWTKLAFGSGDWSISSFGTLRQIFYAIFLTDVVGLEPRLASFAALLGILWDAVNDPLVGAQRPDQDALGKAPPIPAIIRHPLRTGFHHTMVGAALA